MSFTLRERLAVLEETAENILRCFIRSPDSNYWQHKGADGWGDVGEDLNDYLNELQEYAEEYIENF